MTVPSIIRKWKICLVQVKESSDRFTDLCSTLSDAKISEWSACETLMQEFRAVEVDVMDDYDVREKQGLSFTSFFYQVISMSYDA